jgi:hypothetical protein
MEPMAGIGPTRPSAERFTLEFAHFLSLFCETIKPLAYC